MFTGVVVESFAYVYQMPGGVSLDREQMRETTKSLPLLSEILTASGSFKRIWSKHDIQRSGYIARKDLVPFLMAS